MKKKNRVLLISPNSIESFCGVAKYTKYLAESLEKEFEVHILTEKKFQLRSWKLRELFNFIKIIKKIKPDIVHLQLADIFLYKGFLIPLIPIILFPFKIKVIQTWHEPCGNRNFFKFLLLTLNSNKIISVRPNFKNLVKKNMIFLFRFHLYLKKINFIESSYLIKKQELKKNSINKIKKKYLNNNKRLIVSFGHSYPIKRYEMLFNVLDKKKDQLVIASNLDQRKNYDKFIINLQKKNYRNSKIVKNLNDKELFKLISSADVIILFIYPYVGNWNTTFNISKISKTFTIATSKKKIGYHKKDNVYYIKTINVKSVKKIIKKYSSKKNENLPTINTWEKIAEEHNKVYFKN